MRPLNFFVLMAALIMLAVLLSNDAYLWAGLMVCSIQVVEYIIKISED